MIRINCIGCGGILNIPPHLAGTEAKCPGCKTQIQVPDDSGDQADPVLKGNVPAGRKATTDAAFDPMDVLGEPNEAPAIAATGTPAEPPTRVELPSDAPSAAPVPSTPTGSAAAAVNAMSAMQNRVPVPKRTTEPSQPAEKPKTSPPAATREAFSSVDNFFAAVQQNKLYLVLAASLMVALVVYMPRGCDTGVPRYPVSGRVTFPDGSPVRTGVIEFESVELLLSATGRIHEDGTFTCPEGAPVGASRAIVTQMVISDGTIKHEKDHGKPVAFRFRRYETSGLKFDIKAAENNELKVVVEPEANQNSGDDYYDRQ